MWFWKMILTFVLLIDIVFIGADTEIEFHDGTKFRVNDLNTSH